jgi:hypothetical protein
MLLFQMEMEAQAIFLNMFTVAHHANVNLSFVRLLMKKQTEIIHLQTEKTD